MIALAVVRAEVRAAAHGAGWGDVGAALALVLCAVVLCTVSLRWAVLRIVARTGALRGGVGRGEGGACVMVARRAASPVCQGEVRQPVCPVV